MGACAQFDAGSCIDGRLTSAWNWGSKIEKKDYYHIFKICGFVGMAQPHLCATCACRKELKVCNFVLHCSLMLTRHAAALQALTGSSRVDSLEGMLQK